MTRQELEDFLRLRELARRKRRRERIGQAVRLTAAVLAIAGVILIMGAVGRSEYADICGEYRPVTHLVKWCAVGAAMIMPAGIMKARENR